MDSCARPVGVAPPVDLSDGVWGEGQMSTGWSLSDDGDGHLHSGDGMSAGRLRDRVLAARVSRGMSLAALQRVTGLSPRTLRDIESGNPNRRYSATTLSHLDEAFGWDVGTAYGLWRDELDGAGDDMRRVIAEQMAALAERVARMEERPPWAAELIDCCRLLSPEDRSLVLGLARRLAAR